ncbi:hypothetical protein [Mesorhizobium sp.]|uniref:hypothetical protein n=1 Tax=Mesorhizobium sp. TaxID=1871066 RepID=UPI0025BEDD3B|nr:hypothetical protein [Mesorhizobium sp.]
MSDVLFMCRPELAQNLFGFVGRMAIARQLIDKSALWRAIIALPSQTWRSAISS